MAFDIKTSFTGGLVDDAFSARPDLSLYPISCSVLNNFIVNPSGGVFKRPGMRHITSGSPENNTRLIPFIYSDETAYLVLLCDETARFIVNGEVLVDGQGDPVTVTHGLTGNALYEFTYVQSIDTLFIAHHSAPPFKIIRTSETSFEKHDMDFSIGIASPGNLTATLSPGQGGGFPITYGVTARKDTGEESEASTVIEPNGFTVTSWTSGMYITLNWDEVAGVDAYRIYKDYQGHLSFIGEVRDDGSATFSFIDENYEPLPDLSPPTARNPFATSDSYPGVVSIYQQRLWYANLPINPQAIYASRVGVFTDFNKYFTNTEDGPVEVVNVTGKIDAIRWIEGFQGSLYMGTTDRIWEIFSAQGALTSRDIGTRPLKAWGSAQIQPLLIGDSLVYVEFKGERIFDLFISQDRRGLTCDNLSLRASEIFEKTSIRAIAYQRTLDPVIWCVMEDGSVMGLTYIKNQNVWGWHKHTTSGMVRSCGVIPGDTHDEVYFCVQRAGQSSVEKLEDKWVAGDIRTANYLDHSYTYSGIPTTTVTGLDYAEGEDMCVVADGGLLPDEYTVTNGQITIPYEASIIHVGHSYSSEVAPLGIEFVTQEGITLGRTKRVLDMTLRLVNTVGGKYGPNMDELLPLEYTPETWGHPVQPFTGDIRDIEGQNYDSRATMYVVQDQPYPMTLLGIFVTVTTEDM